MIMNISYRSLLKSKRRSYYFPFNIMYRELQLKYSRYSSAVDMRLAESVGSALPSVVRGETTMLEHMRPNGMLDDFYTESLGLPASNRYLARMIKQLAHRYPRMNFIEIGEYIFRLSTLYNIT